MTVVVGVTGCVNAMVVMVWLLLLLLVSVIRWLLVLLLIELLVWLLSW